MTEIKSPFDKYFKQMDAVAKEATQEILSEQKTYQDAFKLLRNGKFRTANDLHKALLDEVENRVSDYGSHAEIR